MAQELQFIEAEAGKWFYVLEDRHAPKDTWDWMEFADAFGPFPSLEAAQDHEYESSSDTSGCEIVDITRSHTISAQARKLIAEARV